MWPLYLCKVAFGDISVRVGQLHGIGAAYWSSPLNMERCRAQHAGWLSGVAVAP